MVPSAPSPPSPSRPRALVLLLAFGVFGGGTAWVLHLTLSYAVVPLVCAWEDATLLHLLTGGMGLVALGAVVASVRALRLAGKAGRGEVDRFLAVTGIVLSGFFLALILAEGLPVLMMEDPCRAVPTQDRPIVQVQEGPEVGTQVLEGGLPIHGTPWAGEGIG